MPITTISSREFNHDVSKAKRAALYGPVFIKNRGHVEYVLLTVKAYEKITKKKESIVDLLSMPGVGDIDFEPPRLKGIFSKPADFT